MAKIHHQIAQELGVRDEQVEAAVTLLDGGATVPFIARYRKELTGALDDAQLRTLEERLTYLRELEERRTAVLNSIREQGKLDAALEAQIMAADSKGRLEDIYLPYKPKRRTKAEIAKEAGLEPLADQLLTQPQNDPNEVAAPFVNAEKQVADVAAALDGARAILVERFAEDADLIGALREEMWSNGIMVSTVRTGKKTEGEKFKDYFDFSEPLPKLPSHRILALFRGEKEEILDLTIKPEAEAPAVGVPGLYELRIMNCFAISNQGRKGDKWLAETVRWAWRTKIQIHLNIDLRLRLWTAAETEAVRVFASNLRDLLLAAPAGPRATMGLDPGYRTGVKVAVIDATGKVVAHTAIFPHEPQRRWDEALAILGKLAIEHGVELIAIGNGTASRETDKLAAELVKRLPERKMTKIVVSEAGASVYSASAFASNELPDLDVTIRGAVSIARRLQDPLAELVKIDPKAIGVGQYQHDLGEAKLARSLDAVVEDCVNAVGVDANTASVPLLTRVSGLSAQSTRAEAIVAAPRRRRSRMPAAQDAEGRCRGSARAGLRAVRRLPAHPRRCGGARFASSIHPEAYPVARKHSWPAAAASDIKRADGRQPTSLRKLEAKICSSTTRFGLPTVKDILLELEKPGRDPRPAFKAAVFKEGVEEVKDLKQGMILEGTVTNVAAFGAFVDIGVHQDGLVHISAMSRTFIKDPREVVKPGDIVKVKVLDVEVARKRIALTLRLDDEVGPKKDNAAPSRDFSRGSARMTSSAPRRPQEQSGGGGALADALRRAAEKSGRGKPT